MYSIKDLDGEVVDPSKYIINVEKKTFSSNNIGLILDFEGCDGWFFNVRWDCKFKTGSNCKFETYWNCIFTTDRNCSFNTKWNCLFNVGNNCKLKCWFSDVKENFKVNKGYHVIGDNEKLHKDIDGNWAILNSKHNNKFIRDVCKGILEGSLDV